MAVDSLQVLPKPPRLLSIPNGEQPYDWREFDRWMQRAYLLLGTQQGSAFNIPNSLGDTDANVNAVAADEAMSSAGFQQVQELANAEVAMQNKGFEDRGDTQALTWM